MLAIVSRALPPFNANLALGTALAPSWVNAGLFTIEVIQASSYFATYHDDPLWTRCLVGFSLICDLFGVLCSYAVVYLCDLEFLVGPKEWPEAAILGGAFATAITFLLYPLLTDYDQIKVPVTVWYSTSAANDALLAITLVVLLSVARKKVSKSTSHVYHPLGRLIRSAAETGSLPAVWTVVQMIIFLVVPATNLSSAMSVVTGRLYTLTLLYNLNLRRRAAKSLFNSDGMLDTSGEESRSALSKLGSRVFGGGLSRNGAMELQGVSVHREELTTVEDERVRVVTFDEPLDGYHSAGEKVGV
ncbi:hypothetical protein RQP46_010749 [Phenoliferia psychrophenolica]